MLSLVTVPRGEGGGTSVQNEMHMLRLIRVSFFAETGLLKVMILGKNGPIKSMIFAKSGLI